MATFSFGEFMREGGWGMWPVLMLGLVALASATRYALRPERLCLRFVAVLWLTLLVADRSRDGHRRRGGLSLLEDPARAPDGQMARLLVMGLKESTRPAALGGVFLTLVPLLAAAGVYREYYRRPLSVCRLAL